MQLPIYQIDAFTSKLFAGNPAAVIPLQNWLDDELMQKIAMENNLSETAFFVPVTRDAVSSSTGGSIAVGREEAYDLRWFTPSAEINLCGHATLASAYVLYNILNFSGSTIRFNCKSGVLNISRKGDLINMDFPGWKLEKVADPPLEVLQALGAQDVEGVYRNRDLLLELKTEGDVKKISPDFTRLKKTGENVIVTSTGADNSCDFVSRFFAPSAGIDEDPVTGSAHSQLIPFWAEKLNKNKLHAKQLSDRGGELWCEFLGNRVVMSGYCVYYMKGEISI